MEQNLEQNKLKDLLIVLFKHKYKILIVFLAINIAVTIKTYRTKPVYETQASLMVHRPAKGQSHVAAGVKTLQIAGQGLTVDIVQALPGAQNGTRQRMIASFCVRQISDT